MKRSSRISKTGSMLTLVGLVAVGCAPSTKVQPGAPQLMKFVVVGPGNAIAELVTEAGAPKQVSTGLFAFAHFDRILDPTPLETVDPDGGVITPKAGVARVEWSGGEIPANTLYIPNGDVKWTLIPALFGLPFGIGPSITITPTRDGTSDATGFPSGATVTVTLDPLKVRSRDQKNAFVAAPGVASPLVFETEPLQAAIEVPAFEPPDGGADAGAPDARVVKVTFNNLTPASNQAAIQVAVTVGGAPAPGVVAEITQSTENGAEWSVAPPMDGWPPGATVTVTVTTAATDNFQVPLAAATSATFTVMQ